MGEHMKILIIGEGAREHAISKKLAKSERVEKIFIAPGNGGTSRENKCVNIPVTDFYELRDFAESEGVGITIVGPEVPLMEGIVDIFHEKGLKIIGPDRKSSLLEGSKAFSKEFMKKYGIKTAAYETFTDFDKALQYVKGHEYPLVIKADGLAQGKGVEIPFTYEDARRILESFMLEGKFKDAGKTVVIEEFITGKEASIISIFDGKSIHPFISAMDHKKIGEGETGLNTGGMGSLCPNPYYSKAVEKDFNENILARTLQGLVAENLIFTGIIFFGVIMNEKGAYLLEYNLRFGDPETQSLMEHLDSDLLAIFEKALDGTLAEGDIIFKDGKTLCVVLAAKGYPEAYEKNVEVSDLEDEGVSFYLYSSDYRDGKFISKGGRFLSVVAHGKGDDVFDKVYGNIRKIENERVCYRRDIGRV
jgi:phosphoribosylamine--glycine ligase